MGGLAQLLAAVAVATGTLTLLTGHLLATSTADLTVWVVIGWLTTRLLRTPGHAGCGWCWARCAGSA